MKKNEFSIFLNHTIALDCKGFTALFGEFCVSCKWKVALLA